MKFLFLIMVSFFPSLLLADQTLNEPAVQLCKEMEQTSSSIMAPLTETLQMNCLDQIANKQFDAHAVEVCKGLRQTSKSEFATPTAILQIRCLNQIANKQFDAHAVEVCKGLRQTSDSKFAPSTIELQMECLDNSNIADNNSKENCTSFSCPPPQRPRTETDTNSSFAGLKKFIRSQRAKDTANSGSEASSDPEPKKNLQARSEAIEFCRKEVASHSRDECLDIVVPARFVDRSALSVCASLPEYQKNECLSAIVDKLYDPVLIEECDEKSSYEKTECLLRWGMPLVSDLQPTFTVHMQVHSAKSLPPCEYDSIFGQFPEGGGCNFDGCWMAGGGCNFDGCWMAGGHCNFDGCVLPAPEKVCQ